MWGIYLDGGEAGITIHGNIIGATLHGAVFDNAGGNNTQTNNIFAAGPDSPILMDFGAPGTGSPRAIAGNTVKKNIFYFHGQATASRSMFGSMVGWSPAFLKPNGSDYNLFFSPNGDADAAKVFPGGTNLSEWSGRSKTVDGPVTCSNTQGAGGDLIVSSDCSYGWDHNTTTVRQQCPLLISPPFGLILLLGKHDITVVPPPPITHVCNCNARSNSLSAVGSGRARPTATVSVTNNRQCLFCTGYLPFGHDPTQ